MAIRLAVLPGDTWSMPELTLRRAAPPVTQEIWAAIRRRRTPWTTDDIVAASGASDRQVRRFVSLLAREGVLTVVDRSRPARYTLARDLGPLAPRMLRTACDPEPTGMADRNSDMTAAEFAAARAAAGLSIRGLARAIGYRDERTVRRFEAGGRPIPRAVAERVRAIALRPRSS